MEAVPAADLDRPQLGVLESLPGDVCLAAEFFLAPPKDLEVVFGRVIAKPVDVRILLEPGLAHGTPDLDHPAEHPEVVVDPVERAANDLLRVIAELMVDGDIRIPRDFSPFGADLLVMPEILGVHLRVR